ncbi:MAG: hypothetical protein ACI9S8_000277 [Chlamydiales bacterium]|jgi:hypothetical protein
MYLESLLPMCLDHTPWGLHFKRLFPRVSSQARSPEALIGRPSDS